MATRLNSKDDDLAPFIRLVLRSQDVGDGWRNVSNTLRNFTTNMVNRWPDLFEVREMASMQIRLSEKGLLLSEYAA